MSNKRFLKFLLERIDKEKINEEKKTNEEEILQYLIKKYPTEPYFTTAKAYVDCIDEILNKYDWKAVDRVRMLNWNGVKTDSQTFLKQAQIIGEYNEFNPEIAKKIVDYFGDKVRYRLGREGSVVVYVDANYSHSDSKEFEQLADQLCDEFQKEGFNSKLSKKLGRLFSADEVSPGKSFHEIRIWWD